MSDTLQAVLAALGANTLMVGVLAYLSKTILDSRQERDRLKFKAALELKASEQMDAFRSHLEIERLRLQISYGGIFQKQAEAILTLFKAMVDLERGINDAINFGMVTDDRQERYNRYRKPWAALRDTFQDVRILLPEELDSDIEAFMDKAYTGASGYLRADMQDFSRLSEAELNKVFRQQDHAMTVVNNDVAALRDRLIKEMRRILGVAKVEIGERSPRA
jgi:hypothetical protein